MYYMWNPNTSPINQAPQIKWSFFSQHQVENKYLFYPEPNITLHREGESRRQNKKSLFLQIWKLIKMQKVYFLLRIFTLKLPVVLIFGIITVRNISHQSFNAIIFNVSPWPCDNKSASRWIMFDYFFHVWKVNIFSL